MKTGIWMGIVQVRASITVIAKSPPNRQRIAMNAGHPYMKPFGDPPHPADVAPPRRLRREYEESDVDAKEGQRHQRFDDDVLRTDRRAAEPAPSAQHDPTKNGRVLTQEAEFPIARGALTGRMQQAEALGHSVEHHVEETADARTEAEDEDAPDQMHDLIGGCKRRWSDDQTVHGRRGSEAEW